MKYFCSCCNYDAKVKSSYDNTFKNEKTHFGPESI